MHSTICKWIFATNLPNALKYFQMSLITPPPPPPITLSNTSIPCHSLPQSLHSFLALSCVWVLKTRAIFNFAHCVGVATAEKNSQRGHIHLCMPQKILRRTIRTREQQQKLSYRVPSRRSLVLSTAYQHCAVCFAFTVSLIRRIVQPETWNGSPDGRCICALVLSKRHAKSVPGQAWGLVSAAEQQWG